MPDLKQLATWAIVLSLGGTVQGLTAEAVHSAPSATEARTQALGWTAAQGITDKALLNQVGKTWALDAEQVPASLLLDRVIATFGLVDEKSRKFVAACDLADPGLGVPGPKLIADNKDGFYKANMGLFYGRYLTQRRLFDEALEVFAGLDAGDVVDPAGYLYFKAVCEHQLLQRTDGLATIRRLLENTSDVPLRYTTVAKLMQHDLQQLKKDSLAEISRKMRDVERRLELGRGGQRVQKEEDEIVAALDVIIEKLEQQGGT